MGRRNLIYHRMINNKRREQSGRGLGRGGMETRRICACSGDGAGAGVGGLGEEWLAGWAVDAAGPAVGRRGHEGH